MRLFQVLMEASYDTMVSAMCSAYPDQADNIRAQVKWAKAALVKADRITWYLRIIQAWLSGNDSKLRPLLGTYQFNSSKEWDSISELGSNIQHFLGYNDTRIQNYQFVKQPASEVINDLSNLETQYNKKQENKQPSVKSREGDHVIFDFGNGLEWWFVDRAYCDEEGRSGSHCGNVVGKQKTDQRILSLRKNGHVLLTFILEPDGSLGEMKAKGNQKPSEKYHPQIMKLLMWDKVTGISGMGYLPDANFSIFDLDEKNLNYIDKHKPQLIADQLKITPFDLLKQPDHIRKRYADMSPMLHDVIMDPSHGNWKKLIDGDPDTVIYAPHDLPNFKIKLSLAFHTTENPASLMLRCPDSISRNMALLQTIIREVPSAIEGVVPSMADASLWVSALLSGEYDVEDVPDDVRPDLRDEYFRRVQSSGNLLSKVPPDLVDEAMCIAAVKNNREALAAIPKEQRKDRVYIAAVTSHSALGLVPKHYRTPAVCLASVTHHGHSLEYVPDDIKTSEICMAAVSNTWTALGSIPEDVLDEGMCVAAVRQNGAVLSGIPTRLRTQKVCMTAVENTGGVISYIPKDVMTEDMCVMSLNNSTADTLLLDILTIPVGMKTPSVCKLMLSKWAELFGPTSIGEIEKLIPDPIKSQLGALNTR